jgi:hypothetical protein
VQRQSCKLLLVQRCVIQRSSVGCDAASQLGVLAPVIACKVCLRKQVHWVVVRCSILQGEAAVQAAQE